MLPSQRAGLRRSASGIGSGECLWRSSRTMQSCVPRGKMELSRSHPAERYQDMDAEYDTDWQDVSDSQYDTYTDETHSIATPKKERGRT